ncbi:hypothetical protein FRC03_010435 [Tulasnella sp. 419]|nr:hypothetical protein FRC03_010435 [Tulasnella sp. 419]
MLLFLYFVSLIPTSSSRASSFAPPEQGKPVSAANGPEIREEVSSNHVIDPRSDPPKTATTVLSESLHIRLRSLLSLPGSDISTQNPLMNSLRARPRGKSYNLKSITRSSNDSRLDITPTLHRFPTNFEGLGGQVVVNEMNE